MIQFSHAIVGTLFIEKNKLHELDNHNNIHESWLRNERFPIIVREVDPC